ncbi:MAG TPA: hypothetical protein VMB02_15405 [Candidatus Aquilonibacter sp.]|nr:hypothetical protein [Candidatus Aquilonibacter sp.]
MGLILGIRLARGSGARGARRLAPIAALALSLSFLGCHRIPPIDTSPLDNAGIGYDAVQQLKTLNITTLEIAEIVKAKRGGFSDDSCVEMVRIYRGRKQAFDAGDAIAGLVQAGMGQDTILALGRLNQLGLAAGELQAMRLAGLSDEIIFDVAQHHSAGQPVLSGVSLARLQNLGMRESTLLELVRRSIPDSETPTIVSLRRHGANDQQILKRFAGS